MTNQSTLGSRIEQARVQIGLTSSQLANRAGVRSKTLENWESDRSEPRAEKLIKLSGILQVPLIWLLTGETPEGSKARPRASETTNITQKLDRAVALQQDLAALLIELSADVARLQRELDEDQELAA